MGLVETAKKPPDGARNIWSGRLRVALEAWLTQQWLHRGAWAYLSWPLSVLYGGVLRWQRWHVESHQGRQRLPVPVVVVGNVIVGGAGKTPVCVALVQHLQRQGWRPGIVSRGYGRATGDDATPFDVQADTDPRCCGDEPLLLKQLTGAVVMVGRDRMAVGAALLQRHPSIDVLVLDDGLQHRRLHTDVRVVVFDERGLGNGCLLPAGLLREPWPLEATDDDEGLLVLRQAPAPQHPTASADAPSGGVSGASRLSAALTHTPPSGGVFHAQRTLSPTVFGVDGQVGSLTALAQHSATSGPCLALAGIAKPQQFFNMLREQGFVLADTWALGDHADMSTLDLHRLHTSKPMFTHIVCTEKDSVKLFPLWRAFQANAHLWGSTPHNTQHTKDCDTPAVWPCLWAIPLTLHIDPSFFDAIDQQLSRITPHEPQTS